MSNTLQQIADYGLNQPVNFMNPGPIVSLRAPTTADKAPLGTLWVEKSNNTAYIITSIANNQGNWLNMAGGAGAFSSLTVTPGPTSLTGALTTISAGHATNIATDAVANAVTIGSTTTTSTVVINGGTTSTPAITLNSAQVLMGEGNVLITSPATTATLNTRSGNVQCSGFTTVATASQSFTITNAQMFANSSMLVTISNGGTNAALMSLTGITQGAGSFVVTVTNNGAQALNGDIHIVFWIFN